jgi:CheY-like chemotaxis protein
MRFILIDDDAACNMISRFTLRKAIADVTIDVFTEPEKGLEFIQKNYNEQDVDRPTVLFLDINMPSMTGWEFLDQYATLGEHVHRNFTIYMLTSSIDTRDKEKAANSPFVAGFLSKPLSVEKLRELFNVAV